MTRNPWSYPCRVSCSRALSSVWDTNPQATTLFSYTLHVAVIFRYSLYLFVWVHKGMQVHVKNTHVPDVPGRAKTRESVGHCNPYPEFQHSRGWPEDDEFKASLDCITSSSPAWGTRWDSVSKQKWQNKIQPAKQYLPNGVWKPYARPLKPPGDSPGALIWKRGKIYFS